jgi:hypothetical protein
MKNHRGSRGIHLLLTSALDVVNAIPRSLYTPERDPIPVALEAGWASEPFWMGSENLTLSDSIPGPSSL